jgi:hypothetical protein
MPKEFARHPRSLLEYARWKATEFRMFLLYSGPVVLLEEESVPQEIRDNFLLLSCGIHILIDPSLCRSSNEVAKDVLQNFVAHYIQLFGYGNVVFNVHGLIYT